MAFPTAFCRYFPGRSLRIVVTGINGFLGSHVGRELRSQGHYVVGADWVRHRDHAIPLEESCDEFYLCDLRTYDAWYCLLSWPLGHDEQVHVFHCASEFHCATDVPGTSHATLSSTLIDMHMLEACRATGIDRAVYISRSNPTLGDSLMEDLCRRYTRDYAMDIRVARMDDVYGPLGPWKCQEHLAATVCRKVAAAARQGDALELHFPASHAVACLYIDDAVESLLRVMLCDANPGIVAVNGVRVTMAALANTAMDVAAKHLAMVCPAAGDSPPTVSIAPPVKSTAAASVVRALHWEPTTPLHRGMAVLYSWVSDQVAAHHPDHRPSLRRHDTSGARVIRPIPLGTYARHGRPSVPPLVPTPIVSRVAVDAGDDASTDTDHAGNEPMKFHPHASVRALQASLRPILTR